MSLRVYVNEEGVKKVKEAQGFYKTGRDGCEQWHIPGIITLAYEKGLCFLTLNEISDSIPSVIVDFIEEITIRDYHRASKRESGIYRHKTAEAEVVMDSSGMSVSIFIRGKSKEDALDLMKKIKTGAIRPEESYEAPQDGILSSELRAKLTELERENSTLRSYITTSSEHVSDLRAGVKKYISTLSDSRMPIVLSRKVIDELESIFNPFFK